VQRSQTAVSHHWVVGEVEVDLEKVVEEVVAEMG
jgi:hypothetical protein